MSPYPSSSDSFPLKKKFVIGKAPEALPRRRVKFAVEEDVDSRALATLDRLGRIRTALTNYLARKDIKSKNRKRMVRKLGALNKVQVALTKVLEKAKERGEKVPRRIIKRTMSIIDKRVRRISENRPAQIAYKRYLRALRERAFAQSSISPQTLVGLFSLLHNGGSSKGYKDHMGESLDRFGGRRAMVKIKDKGGEIFIVRRTGDSLKLTHITHDTRKVPGKFVITAEGKKIQRNKYIRTREKKELVVRFKIIGGKWVIFDKAGKRIQKAPKMRYALSGLHDEGLTVAVRGKGEEIARGPKISKAPKKRKREKPVIAVTPVPLKFPGKKSERPMVVTGKSPKIPTAPKVEQPEVKISGLKPEQTAKIVAARAKFIRVLEDPKASPYEIRSAFGVFLSKLPLGIKLLGMKKTLHPKTYSHILRIIYGNNEREIIAKLPISDKERFARIMSKVVVPQEAFKINSGAERSALRMRIDDMILYIKGFTARVARQIISDHKDDPKWRGKSPAEKGKKGANLVFGLIRNLKKLSAKLERGKDVPAKELAVAFSVFRPSGKAHKKYLAKVLPKVKTLKKEKPIKTV